MPVMTKLVRFLTLAAVLFAVWVAMLQGRICKEFTQKNEQLILFAPVLVVALFGVYSLTVLVYRVATFNDCEGAAKELAEEIKEAKEDLKNKGIKMD